MQKELKTIELIIDDSDDMAGVNAVSVVSNPAIEELFITLNAEEVMLKADKKRNTLVGPALIPNKKIYRVNPKTKEEYNIFFSEETVRKASEKFLIDSNQKEATLEHKQQLKGMTVVESWIIESKNDKSKDYGMDLPLGTWMISMKVTPEIYAKAEAKEVQGFSIEGYFADKYEMSIQEESKNNTLKQLKDLLTINNK